eukprot:CAMPEP_0173228146 /NCGR_PEP_ID=MMETSP1142-20121109/6359_1 /TAXON_ID=483371 /ORGANISM="non described non described, Strain CCMP2298" /LENGTH=165 /DNA_ID=CAMNT_0014156745 /DNA_START=1146 /DNA_END=1640 /DNA_ORIENTATION=-
METFLSVVRPSSEGLKEILSPETGTWGTCLPCPCLCTVCLCATCARGCLCPCTTAGPLLRPPPGALWMMTMLPLLTLAEARPTCLATAALVGAAVVDMPLRCATPAARLACAVPTVCATFNATHATFFTALRGFLTLAIVVLRALIKSSRLMFTFCSALMSLILP